MIVVDKIINDDGTDYDPPKNPLAEKWNRLYPGCESTGYKCMYCGDCPHGEYWTVPDEDRDVYDDYLDTVKQYNIKHGNFLIPRIILKKKEKLNERIIHTSMDDLLSYCRRLLSSGVAGVCKTEVLVGDKCTGRIV